MTLSQNSNVPLRDGASALVRPFALRFSSRGKRTRRRFTRLGAPVPPRLRDEIQLYRGLRDRA